MPDLRWIILAVLFAARAATGFQFQSIGSATSALMGDLSLGYAEIGVLLGAYLLPGVVVAFPAGLIGQRVSDKTLGVIGLLLMALSGAALSEADGLATALVARMIGGVGATILILAATKMTTDWFDGREIVLAMSLLQMSWPFGAMVALPVQSWLLQSAGWPAVMLSGAICALAVLAAFVIVPRGAPQTQAAGTSQSRGRLPPAVLLPVIVAGVIWGVMNLSCVLFFSYAPMLLQVRGLTPTTAASLTSLAIWCTIVAIPLGGYLVHRSGKPVAAIVGCGLVAALALALFAAGILPPIIGLIFGIAIGPLSGAILSLPARVLEPRDRSLGFGVFYTCFYVLMAVGPSAAGQLQDAWNTPSAALFGGAALLALMIPLVLGFEALSRRREAVAVEANAELRTAS
ncbi:CynX/NimT family MFS transporter [Bradyrhizobium lablabi]|uniref:MFS transporter n=1 Tax=Bradyrhizobium lablabi TaxID=722472 RepID=UPI001BAA6D8C|nr:MFS transporter [Bradyrhizobium lablabi]MBR0696908.1 MFS transporter [Bradyrhizobium lablabi]